MSDPEKKEREVSPQDAANFLELAKQLGATVRRVSLYFYDHPLVQDAYKRVLAVLQTLFSDRAELNFGYIDGKIIIENVNLTEKGGQTMVFLDNAFRSLSVESLNIMKGVGEEELKTFIMLMADPQKTVKDGGLAKLLVEKQVVNITINQSVFIQVKKGDTVITTPIPKGEPAPKAEEKSAAAPVEPGVPAKTDTPVAPPKSQTAKAPGLGSGLGAGQGAGLGTGEGAGAGQGTGKGPGTGAGPGSGGITAEPKKAKRMKRIAFDEYKELLAKSKNFDEILQKKIQLAINDMLEDKQHLVREKEKVERILRSISDGLVVVNAEGQVMFMNDAAEKLLGKPKKDVAGKNIIDTLEDHQIASFSKEVPGASPADKVAEIVVHGRENTKKVLRASSAIIEDTNGMTVGTVSVLSDVTKQKELDQLKDKFVAHVSHELRSPLTIIKGAVLTVKDKIAGDINKDQEDLLNDAALGIGRLERLINDLLDIAKIESGKMELKLSQVDLKTLINSVVDQCQLWAKNKNLELKAVTAETPLMQLDGDKVTQIVMNLISNAIKFTPEHGLITVESVLDSSRNAVVVSVQDTGPGLTPDNLKKIFQKFEQFGSMRGGSGLGLFISKELVEMHGGQITVESNVGQGTKFTFSLPIKT
jgi:PAS domain S-box-containing protein